MKMDEAFIAVVTYGVVETISGYPDSHHIGEGR
jgi:hypothetical protein